MGPQFHETAYGKRFFGSQIPKLTEALERIAQALERKEETLCIKKCKETYETEREWIFEKGKEYILRQKAEDIFEVYETESGRKATIKRSERTTYFEE